MSLIFDRIAKAEADITKILLDLEHDIEQDVKHIELQEHSIKVGDEIKPVRRVVIGVAGNSGPMWHTGSWDDIL